MTRLRLLDDRPVPGFPTAGTAGLVGMEKTLKIGDLAKATDKTQRALRLYEELGLLTPGDRTSGGFRLYGPDAIQRVHWIGKLQELGFTLQQIQELVGALHQERVPKDAMARVRGLFLDKLDDVAAQIARLSQLQRELMSSLAYLEACGGCGHEAVEGAPGTASCARCDSHSEAAPPLLNQMTRL